MTLDDTIIAVASGAGQGARGVVRLSGPGTFAVIGEDDGKAGARRVRLGVGGGSLACLALTYRGPRSFTGEDSAELLLPGNVVLLERVVAELLRAGEGMRVGVRLAQPGEFTARAFLHGKLTAEQAEGVGALIGARSEGELAAAERLLSGRTGDEYRAIADELASALALVEAGIDFTDQEDVVAIGPDELLARLRSAAAGIDGHIGTGSVKETAAAEPLVVLVGAPNAGKSTLFNALLGRARAVVSEVAGTTRDVLVERLDLSPFGGSSAGFGVGAVTIVDLAGLDPALSAGNAVDASAQRAARGAIDRADVIVHCDPAGRFDDRAIGVEARGRPVVRVRTKADLGTVVAEKTVQEEQHGEEEGGKTGRSREPSPRPSPRGRGSGNGDDGRESKSASVSVCAIDGWGVGALGRAIGDAAERVGSSAGHDDRSVLPRHRQALGSARERVVAAMELVEADVGARHLERPEVVAGLLRAALDSVGEIAGRISPDDVIGRIFATFCIGK